jgi:hypothetical protein
MEKIINKKIETYTTSFKNDVSNKIKELSFEDKSNVNQLLEFVYDYHRLSISKEDMIKRKRIKNAIPDLNRCNAKRASGEQCTRRRKEDCEFCGTHLKGVPHGLIISQKTGETCMKMDVIAQEISGIVYYIDTFENVYKTEDILEGKENPQIVAKYVKHGENQFSIPFFGI